MSLESNSSDFNFSIPLSIYKGGDGKTYFQGIASTEDKDLQGEIVKQDGIELDYFIKNGLANDDHGKSTSDIIGVPTEAKITKNGLFVKGYFLDTDRAKGIIEVGKAFEAAGGDRRLSFSIEGRVLGRDEKKPHIITKCWLSKVAITAQPINPNTYLEFAKSFANQNLKDVFINKDITKSSNKEPKNAANEDKEIDSDLEKMAEVTKKPTDQRKIEKKDADETALKERYDLPEDYIKSTSEALDPDTDTEAVEKKIDDVPLAKKPSLTKDVGGDDVDLDSGGGDDGMEMSIGKAFSLVSSNIGDKDIKSKKIPVHHQVYEHKKSGHQISVSGKDGTFVVVHSHKSPKGEMEHLGMQVFADVPEKGKKANEDVCEYLNGFGIKHKIADKKTINKSFEETEKALTTGYTFGVVDQTDGAALRVEDLEGVVKDLDDINNVEQVGLTHGNPNGGAQEMTLKDALDFLQNRGFTQGTADRILMLMIRNGGDLSNLNYTMIQ